MVGGCASIKVICKFVRLPAHNFFMDAVRVDLKRVPVLNSMTSHFDTVRGNLRIGEDTREILREQMNPSGDQRLH